MKPPRHTTYKRILAQREADKITARAANALDAQAEVLLRSDPRTLRAVEAGLAKLRPTATLRGLAQHVLRRVAKRYAQTCQAAQEARALHQQADSLYWRMALAWKSKISQEALRLCPKWRLEPEEIAARLQLSWYESALRFNPDLGASYDQYAQKGEWAHYPEAGPPNPLVRVPRGSGLPWPVILSIDLGPLDDEDWERIEEALIDPGDPSLDVAARRQLQSRAQAALHVLNERERYVVLARTGEEEPTLSDVGQVLDLSRERVRQIEQAALRKLRTELEQRGAV